MNAHEQKQAARAERMRARAASLQSEVAARHAHDQKIHEVMNGTPILVGHHSEGRHRRQVAKFHRNIRKNVEQTEEAAALERRADAVESNSSISSDDPDALAKLRAKLAELDADAASHKASMKAARAIVKLPATPEERLRALLEARVPRSIVSFYAAMGRLPTVSSSGERRRLLGRIVELETRDAAAPRRATFAGGSVEETKDRVRISYDDRCDDAALARLRGRGFVWARSVGAFVRKRTAGAWRDALQITGAIEGGSE